MSTFQSNLANWLSRKVPDRSIHNCSDIPVVLGSEIGSLRADNQDRIAALKISSKISAGRPTSAIAIADGMGGLRDGAKAAQLAISWFFFGLVRHRGKDPITRLKAAALEANNKIHQIYDGNGGATLTAVVIDHFQRIWSINIGDSRIYARHKTKELERLSIDDSLEEAVGGHGRDLLQFLGMGEGILPHINELNSNIDWILLTTDGAHGISPITFEKIVENSVTLTDVTSRLLDVSIWHGGRDNATVAAIDLQKIISCGSEGEIAGIQVWDPYGDLHVLWAREEIIEAPPVPMVDDPIPAESDSQELLLHTTADPLPISQAGKKKKKKKDRNKDDNQIEIEIETSPDDS